eukprot:139406-Pleurochrysis_carterae.AAC.1
MQACATVDARAHNHAHMRVHAGGHFGEAHTPLHARAPAHARPRLRTPTNAQQDAPSCARTRRRQNGRTTSRWMA